MLHRGATPSIANLYTEARTLLRTGLEAAAAAHGAIGWAGTLALWLDILPHLFTASATHYTLPGPWVTTRPDLRGTQLQIAWVATPGGQSHATLVRHPTPNWLSANSAAHLHRLLGVLAPLDHQLRASGCPWCVHTTASWMHTLQDCAGFWELASLDARCWLSLLRTWGIGYGLVGALTRVLGLLELAATSLYEPLMVPGGPGHDATQFADI